ncbi:uncharacterized protein LOC110984894 isoform X2 [Acanthaster planci]|uniref:Uncharacterized protein LOC110984894 isoform X2 n=1 Tax=Acanthaster planci TaxID=133434 RepID=A0A8B7Z6D6_ACAPL|nr:uncharacterized protein LOC110984894 isoform X2 [Acanthaster planci]
MACSSRRIVSRVNSTISGSHLLDLTDEEFDAVLQILSPRELEDAAHVLQDAINKLQHEYKRLSSVQYSDEEDNNNQFTSSEQKLAKLCLRNRKCLSRLMTVEWESEKKSESSSELSSEVSSDELTDHQDSDGSEISSECSSCLSHKRDTQTFAELESISEEVVPEGPRPTDLKSCRDFVQSLAAQVEAMQEAIRKSKDDLLSEEVPTVKQKSNYQETSSSSDTFRIGSGDYSDVPEEDPHLAEPEYMYSLNSSRLEDDGSYETPMRRMDRQVKGQNGPTTAKLRNHAHHHSQLTHSLDQSEYEEVLRVPRRHQNRPESGQNYMAVSSMYINTEVPMNNSARLDENSTNHILNSSVPTADDTAIYEFPPADDCCEADEHLDRSIRGSLSSNHHEEVIYKYDGPIIFGISDTSEVVHFEERDNVKKWDPIPIVQDLYSNIQRHQQDRESPLCRAGEVSMEGYMEKLPMGRRRASFIKKWKKRYFRSKQGNLFYYEDHKAKKSLGYIQLVGGRITEISNKCIEVTDLRGRVLLLRCSSRMEFEDWKVILNAESGVYSPTPKSPAVPTIRKHVAIIDMGGCSVRAGVLSDSDSPNPQVFFPCVVATNTKHKDRVAYGFEALTPEVRCLSKLTSPFRNPSLQEQVKFKLSMQTVEGLLDTAFTELGIDPIAYQLMVILPFNLGPKLTEKVVEMIFDRFNPEGVFVQEQALMALYSYKATSGIVVNIGERIDVVPIVDGYIIQKGVYRLPFGGRQITEHLQRLLTEGGYRFFTEIEMYIARYLKERACFVAQDYHAEFKFCSLDPELCSTYIDVEKFDVPNGSRSVKLDYSRFRSTEGLFHPEVWGKDHPGLHTLVYNAIQACSNDIRKQMCRSVYLCGGTTLLPGLAERLRSELCRMLPKSSPVKVHASPERYHSAYNGGTVLGTLSAFDNMCITKEDWKQLGATSLTKWQNT